MNARFLLLAAMVAMGWPAAATTPKKITIANAGAIDSKWNSIPETISRPVYPEAYARAQPQVCVTVGYLLNADGRTSDFSLLKSWSSSGNSESSNRFWAAFAGSASQALAQWQFAPKPEIASPGPVYTATTFVFGPGDAAATKAHCAIPDIAARLVELSHDHRANRLMAGGIFSKLDLGPGREYEIREQQLLAEESQRRSMIAARHAQEQRDQARWAAMDQQTRLSSSGSK